MSELKSETNKPDDGYDRGIVPAETAARMEREGEDFKELPEQEGSIDTTGGYTVDREGLANNYAIEPEMYYETPGDAAAQEEAIKAERAQELKEINEEGGKGPGVI